MLPSSDFTITLDKSKDYLRCAICIHVLAAIIVLRSSLPWMVDIPILLILAFLMLKIARCRLPMPDYHKLSYHPGYWLLHGVNGQQMKYEQAAISFDGGLFKLLTLTGINPRKILVIFNDQMTMDQYRVLMLAARRAKENKSKGAES